MKVLPLLKPVACYNQPAQHTLPSCFFFILALRGGSSFSYQSTGPGYLVLMGMAIGKLHHRLPGTQNVVAGINKTPKLCSSIPILGTIRNSLSWPLCGIFFWKKHGGGAILLWLPMLLCCNKGKLLAEAQNPCVLPHHLMRENLRDGPALAPGSSWKKISQETLEWGRGGKKNQRKGGMMLLMSRINNHLSASQTGLKLEIEEEYPSN